MVIGIQLRACAHGTHTNAFSQTNFFFYIFVFGRYLLSVMHVITENRVFVNFRTFFVHTHTPQRKLPFAIENRTTITKDG